MITSPEQKTANPNLDIADRLGNALFIEYGDGTDDTKLRLHNLALDIINIVSANLEEDDSELLDKVRQSDGYLKLKAKVEVDDGDIMSYIINVKDQLKNKK